MKIKNTALLSSIIILALGIVYNKSKEAIPFEVTSLLNKNHPTRVNFESFRDDFLKNDEILLSIPHSHARNISKQFYTGFIGRIGIKKISHIENFEVLKYEKDKFSLESIKGQFKPALNHSLYYNSIFSKNKQHSLVKIEFNKKLKPKSKRKIVKDIFKFVDDINSKQSIEIHLLGTEVAKHYYVLDIIKNQNIVTPLLAILLCLCIFFLFKRIFFVAAFNYVLLVTYLLTFVIILYLEKGFTSFGGLALMFTLVVTTSDVIHYLCSFETTKGDHRKVRERIFKPCLYTTLTTTVAFSSLYLNEFRPVRNFGIICSASSIIAFICTFYLLPIFISVKKITFTNETNNNMANFITQFISKYYKAISFISILLIIAMTVTIKDIKVDDNFYGKFVDGHPLTESVDHFRDNYQYVGSLDLLFQNEGNDFFTIEKQITEIKGVANVKSLYTVTDYLKSILPKENNEKKIESLISLGLSKGIFDQFYSKKNQQNRMMILLESLSSDEIQRIQSEISLILDRNSIKYQFAGFINFRTLLYDKIFYDFCRSFLLTFVVIFIIFLFIFKSLKWALLGLIPNILPLVFLLFLMNTLGINIENNIVILLCITIGIAVDDTIHFLLSIKDRLPESSLMSSIQYSLNKNLKALIGTTFVIIVSFPCFLIGDLKLVSQMGVFVISSLSIALISDLILLPSVFLVTKKS